MIISRFFMKKQPVEGIALFRILFGLILILNALLLIPGFMDYFGSSGMFGGFHAPVPRGFNLFRLIGHSDSILILVFGIHVISALTFTLGFFTRSSAAIVFFTLISFHARNPLILNSGDMAIRAVLFLMIFSHSGDAFSIDRWMRQRSRKAPSRPRFQAAWAQRLIQLQISFIYFTTAWCKLDGQTWHTGTAAYYSSRLWDFERFRIPYVFDHLWSIRAVTWGSFTLEFLLGTLIWIPPLRIPLVLLGLAFHLGIEWTMNIPVFELLMMVFLIGMLEPKQSLALLERIPRFGRKTP